MSRERETFDYKEEVDQDVVKEEANKKDKAPEFDFSKYEKVLAADVSDQEKEPTENKEMVDGEKHQEYKKFDFTKYEMHQTAEIPCDEEHVDQKISEEKQHFEQPVVEVDESSSFEFEINKEFKQQETVQPEEHGEHGDEKLNFKNDFGKEEIESGMESSSFFENLSKDQPKYEEAVKMESQHLEIDDHLKGNEEVDPSTDNMSWKDRLEHVKETAKSFWNEKIEHLSERIDVQLERGEEQVTLLFEKVERIEERVEEYWEKTSSGISEKWDQSIDHTTNWFEDQKEHVLEKTEEFQEKIAENVEMAKQAPKVWWEYTKNSFSSEVNKKYEEITSEIHHNEQNPEAALKENVNDFKEEFGDEPIQMLEDSVVESIVAESIEISIGENDGQYLVDQLVATTKEKFLDKFKEEEWIFEAVPGLIEGEVEKSLDQLYLKVKENSDVSNSINEYVKGSLTECLDQEKLLEEKQELIQKLTDDVSELFVGEILGYVRHVQKRVDEGVKLGEGETFREQVKNAMTSYKTAWDEGHFLSTFSKGMGQESLKVARDIAKSTFFLPRLGWSIGKIAYYGYKSHKKK